MWYLKNHSIVVEKLPEHTEEKITAITKNLMLEKCEFCENWDFEIVSFEIVSFVKNEIF